VVMGVFEKPAPLDFTDLVFREKTIMGSMSGYGLFDEAIKMMEDPRFKGNAVITQRIGLKELIEEGFRPLLAEKNKHVKTLVSPRL
jgi:(R,R)-butanediol dehydrogenase / meso-butanediol dehydrogenase / diacetyl reductase